MVEHSFDYLDDIPERLYQRLVTHNYRQLSSRHSLQARCLGVLELYQHLIEGRCISLESLAKWVEEQDLPALHNHLTDASLLGKTVDSADYCDEVVLRVLDYLETGAGISTPSAHARSGNDTQSEPVRLEPEDTRPDESQPDESQPVELNTGDGNNRADDPRSGLSDAPAANHQQSEAEPHTGASAEQYPASEQAAPEFASAAGEQSQEPVQAIAEAMAPVHQHFGIERQLGWDLSRGIASQGDIQMLLRAHRLIRSSPYLQSILRLIGRGQKGRYDELESTGLTLQAASGEHFDTGLPSDQCLASVSGIYLGDDISRMLPSEQLMLGHPVLKRLWRARWAEKQLLNYHIRGVRSSHVPEIEVGEIDPQQAGQREILHRGPMVVCLDTSASMKGQPELRARAITLEAMRVARQQKRGCYLYAFSGPDEILELLLDLDATGWQPVLDVLNMPFHGGTDLDGVLHKALSRLVTSAWGEADLLLISDGRFKLRDKAILESFKHSHPEHRFFGLQVGQWNSKAFSDICHRVFSFNHV